MLGCCLCLEVELQVDVLGEGFDECVLGPSDEDCGWVSVMSDDVLEELGWSRWREYYGIGGRRRR